MLKGDHNAAKILAFLKILNLNCEVRYLNPNTYSKDPNFLNISPEGKSPVLQTTMDSFCETNTILRYLSRKHKEKGYGGVIPREEAKIDEWLEYCARNIDPLVKKIIYTKRNLASYLKNEEEMVDDMKEFIQNVEMNLGNRSFLVGYTASLADLCIATSFLYPFFSVYDEYYRDSHSNFNEYLERVEEEFNLQGLPKFFKEVEQVDPCQLMIKRAKEEVAELSRISTARPSRNYSKVSPRNMNLMKDIKFDNIDGSDCGEDEEMDFETFMIKTSKLLVKGVEDLNKRVKEMEGGQTKDVKRSPQFGTRAIIGDTSKSIMTEKVGKVQRGNFLRATEFPYDAKSVEGNLNNLVESSSRTVLNPSRSKDSKLFMNQTTGAFYNCRAKSPQVIRSKNIPFESNFSKN